MATCEMCGETGPVKTTRVEGAELDLCADCQDLGSVVESGGSSAQPTKQVKSRSNSRSNRSSGSTELVPDAGERVKRAREDADLTVAELSDTLKEKASVVRRVESGKLTPDRGLARKFERELGISLYESLPEGPSPGRSDGDGAEGATLGDVADVTRRDD